MTLYILDSNFFIYAADHFLAVDSSPDFWNWIKDRHEEGVLISTEKVREEIVRREDPLAEWVKNDGSSLFLPPTEETIRCLATVTEWAQTRGYDASARRVFASCADSWLVAEAMASNGTIVTRETFSNSMKKVKIPNAAADMGAKCITPSEFFVELGIQLAPISL